MRPLGTVLVFPRCFLGAPSCDGYAGGLSAWLGGLSAWLPVCVSPAEQVPG